MEKHMEGIREGIKYWNKNKMFNNMSVTIFHLWKCSYRTVIADKISLLYYRIKKFLRI